MIGRRYGFAVAALVAGAAVYGAAPAGATTPDEGFAAAVTALNIPAPAGTDLPAIGHGICDRLTSGLQANPVSPVPVVRGVVSQLQAGGISREQAAGLLTAATQFYCPQYGRLLGR